MAKFTCLVPVDGFSWVQEGSKFYLAQNRPHGETQPYHPMDAAGLFMKFAAMAPSREAILAFAKRHGSLFGIDSAPSGRRTWESSFDTWKDEVAVMRSAVELWQAATEKDKLVLSRRIGFLDESACDNEGNTRELIADSSDPERWRHLKSKDHVMAAMYRVSDILTVQLAKRTTVQATYDPALGKGVAIYEPADLLNAMWLQFFEAFIGKRQISICPICSDWFYPKKVGRPKEFCSTSCRVLANSRRKVEALKKLALGETLASAVAEHVGTSEERVLIWWSQDLHSHGRKPAEIASRLGRLVSDVRKWIKSKDA